jgi:hypothetical protein
MPLLNYTTSVAADKSVSEIIKVLTKAGANQILTDYSDGAPVGIAFSLPTSAGIQKFKLPVNADPVEQTLRRQRVEPRFRSRAQAERVAWRILKDWVEAQLAIIQTNMVSVDQVFLPYMLVDGQTTVYDHYLGQQPAIGPAR